MNDPHIDIDEMDNSQTSAGSVQKAETAGSSQSSSTNGSSPARPAPAEDIYGLTNVITGLSQSFRQAQILLGRNPLIGSYSALIPLETIRHLRASQREFLLAWRAMIDSSLERIERQQIRDALREDAEMSDDPKGGFSGVIIEEFED